jgi:hypothetical protein
MAQREEVFSLQPYIYLGRRGLWAPGGPQYETRISPTLKIPSSLALLFISVKVDSHKTSTWLLAATDLWKPVQNISLHLSLSLIQI